MSNQRQSRQGNRGQGAGLAPPSTPSKNGAALSEIIHSLGRQWQLGLPVRDKDWSPLKSTKELPDKVYEQLKRLYWQGDFHEAVGRFVLKATPPSLSDTQSARTARLTLLHEIVKEIDEARGRNPGSRTGTPVGGRNLTPGLRALRTGQSFPSRFDPDTPSSERYQASRSDYEKPFETGPDPGSSTDEDEPPLSPITSSESAMRRVQASPRFETRATTRKHALDSSDSGKAAKLTRTSKGKQRSDRHESGSAIPGPLFKKPSIPEFRSFQANNTSFTTGSDATSSQQARPDMADSFQASTVTTSFNTVSSSQRTLVDTANTSFASDVFESDIKYRKPTPNNSVNLGLLDDQDLMDVEDPVEAQLRREQARMEELSHRSQDCPPRSSSTYGSVDEEVLLEKSFEVEVEVQEEYDPPVSTARQSLTRLPNEGKERGFPVKNPRFPQVPSAERSPFYDPPQASRSGKGPPQRDRRMSSTPPIRAPSKSPKDSPSKLPHYIRDIPQRNLFNSSLSEDLAEDLKEFPYFVLFICSGIASEHNIPLATLLQGVDASSATTNPSEFLEHVCLNLNISSDVLRDRQKCWLARDRGFEGYTFKTRIEFNKPDSLASPDPVFKLNVLPIQADRSCRFQRKLGSDRFLYVNVPSFESSENKPSRFNNDDLKNIQEQFILWCKREHSFLGRTWKAFHIEPIKKKKGRITDDMSDKRVILFATGGIGIQKPTMIGDMINWFFPFNKKNMKQAYCKANARLDLGLSRTIPALTFKPSEILYVDDKIADGTPDDTQFNDDTITSWPSNYPSDIEMNDGCSLISVGAAQLIWQKVRRVINSDEPMPSAFQGRIGGAKGVWMISNEPSSATAEDQGKWILISKSQLKFKPPREDRYDDLDYDIHRLTFEYVNHSRRPVPSELHISFIPILIDRGVPKSIVTDLVVKQLDAKRDELLELVSTTERLYHWVHQEGPSNMGLESPQWQAAMYQSLPEQIKHLLESGFVPGQEPYLADCLYRFIRRRQLWMESKLRVPLSQSTFVLGIADPFGILEPGEVHMEFSTPFTNELTGTRLRSLDNMDILVSRQPACRRSDIQKVCAVKHPKLTHLIDVVVFPTKGRFPLAGKLQGGDYDGDIFWLCWDQAIVEPFKNAPAPVEPPKPEKYRIQQDTRELSEVMDRNDLSTVNDFLEEAFEFRMAPSLLGIVTSHLEKQAYYENQVFSDRLDALCDIHDLLVDAPKQGYKYTHEDFRHFTINDLRCGKPKEPAYKEAMKDCEKKDRDEGDKKRKQNYKHKKENILDYLYFEVIRKHDVATLERVKSSFPKAFGEDPDPDLQYPYLNLREHGSAEVQRELEALVKSLKSVERKWLDITMADEKIRKPDWYSQAVDLCYAMYRSILPKNVDHSDIKPWVCPYLRTKHNVWEDIRSSAFYTCFTRRHKLVWAVAGKQLAELKAASYAGSTMVVPRIKAIMKPKAPKAPKPEMDESEDEFEDAVYV